MYSLILMAAMTAGGDAPSFGYGFYHRTSCYGYCHGCYGSCYGCAGYGCYATCHGYASCYGACYGCYGATSLCMGCSGCSCFGGYGTYIYNSAVPAPVYTAPVSPAVPVTPPAMGGEAMPAPKKDAEPKTTAKLILDVPADARVYIDGHLMRSTSARRVFTTPALEAGQTYFYDVRVVTTVGGKEQAENRRMVIKPGETYAAAFRPEAANAPAFAAR